MSATCALEAITARMTTSEVMMILKEIGTEQIGITKTRKKIGGRVAVVLAAEACGPCWPYGPDRLMMGA